MRQHYILDTAVFIDFPDVINEIEDAVIVIPITVIEELENIRSNGDSYTSFSARKSIRNIDNLKELGSLSKGVYIKSHNVTVCVELESEYTPLDGAINDNKILGVARQYDIETGQPVALVSNDLGLRIKAEAFGIEALPYPFEKRDEKEELDEIYLSREQISELYNLGFVRCDEPLYPNQYVTIKDMYGSSQSAMAIYIEGELVLVKPMRAWDIKPKNREQIFALDALMNDDIPVVVLTGPSGVGKTYLALASAFEQCINKRKHQRILVARPNVPIGNDLGFLPGTKEEKVLNWIQGVTDNAEVLLGSKDSFNMYVEKGVIELEALTYLRGRSLKNVFVIVDEMQNSTPQDIKTILTRIADGSKIVIMGDITQIDNKRVSARDCGLSYLVEKSKESDLVAHIELVDSTTRGAVANWAVQNL